MKTNPFRLALALAAALTASLVLTACGASSGSGEMSDEDKIKTMQKAHDAPLGSGPGTASAPPATTGG